MDELQKKLVDAKKNYQIAIRWLKEALGYKNLMTGTEWLPDGEALISDADRAYNEARTDVLFWRKTIDSLMSQLAKGKNNDRK